MITQDFIDCLRKRADIVQIIGELIDLKKAGSSYKARCPFHEEKSPSFTVNPKKQRFKCFGCGASGDVFAFLQQHQRISFSQAVDYVAGRYHEPVEYDRAKPTPPRSRFHDLKL